MFVSAWQQSRPSVFVPASQSTIPSSSKAKVLSREVQSSPTSPTYLVDRMLCYLQSSYGTGTSLSRVDILD
eukprot:scaffold40209_cov199-Amphora_coffeaeformis.AAC.3